MQPLTVTVGPSPEMCESTWHDNSENAAIPARTVFECVCLHIVWCHSGAHFDSLQWETNLCQFHLSDAWEWQDV